MNDLLQYRQATSWVVIIILLGLFVVGTAPIYILIYVFFALAMAIRTMLGTTKRSVKFGLIISFILAMAVQIVFCTTVVFVAQSHTSIIGHLIAKVFATAIIPLPLMLERFIISNKPADFYPPSVEEAATLSFNFLKNNLNKVVNATKSADKLKSTLSVKNLSATFGDLHRHSSTNYINNGSLTEAYFEKVEESLADPYLYIVISNTGSPASEMIAMFTMKQFNHASLSFDKDLKTIISYNGGVNVYPPGLNPETVEAFHQKPDASILVYRIQATREQKQAVAEKVKQINEDGSAYNILGLVTKHSIRPNIMFCSQFVYKMLGIAGLQYFEKKDGQVRPTDFIELDYHKQLEYCYEIKFK
ncbi:hypothetical protein [Secundilactobacillus malefermentans]|uniref:hypothetical protein n=1 Tax=Secundilactobacillus malefermentans TaxID=176292 RepID=UPI0011C97C7B|nr:hypothetical protein [Secundilactobacillus malefermentans]QEA30953.1 hypothetical protein FGL90_01555 [Secundilactobacillus malefermentans]